MINFNVIDSSTMYYTQDSTADFYLNLRGNSSTAFNSILGINKTLTITFLNTNPSSAFYSLTGLSIDGVQSSVKWLNGNGTPPSGNVNSIDLYSITAMKTGNNLYKVFGSQGKFI